MSEFIYAGQCAKCERCFSTEAAGHDQGINEDDLCRNCAPTQCMQTVFIPEPTDDDLDGHLALHGAGLGV